MRPEDGRPAEMFISEMTVHTNPETGKNMANWTMTGTFLFNQSDPGELFEQVLMRPNSTVRKLLMQTAVLNPDLERIFGTEDDDAG